MPKVNLPSSIVCLLFSFLLLPVVKAGNNTIPNSHKTKIITSTNTELSSAAAAEYASNRLYDSLHLNRLGLARQALVYAYRGLQTLVQLGKLSNPNILTVCDFSQSSDSKRMYIIDIKKFKILMNTYVAHGRNSGLNYASRFSNRPESLQSSLGFYLTKNIYFGEHGLSLRLCGLEKGFNDNAERRAVVIHGADYVDGRRAFSYMGRSFGCPAVPLTLAPKIISLIKDGTCFFIYHPSRNYLRGSKILNG